jgi:tetratricopeptide (TPR) repeat protein
MAIRQQQVVFALAALVVGYGVYSSMGTGSSRGPGRGGSRAPEFVDHPAPNVDLVRPSSRDADALLREFFTEPSDTRPLPLLEFEVPPLATLPGLRPAPAAGPRPELFAQFLRTTRQPELVAGLFDDLAGTDDGGTFEDAVDDAAAVDWDLLTPEEKAERLESYRRQYDWILTNQMKYGRILNRDRFQMRMPVSEPILFLELDPETGQDRYPGMAPVAYDLTTHELVDFGLADTLLNRLELERVEFPAELSRGQYGAAMSFADRAYLAREAGPRALEIAEEFYRKATALTNEPAPRLGLARCHEAAFRFELAFAEYNALLDGGFEQHPVVLARLGVLESRFRLFDLANAHLQEASRFGRAEWEVQLALGNFKLKRREPVQALEALQRAARNEPQAAEHQRVRAWIRTLLGDALLATGELEDARKSYARALQAEPGFQAALAGLQNVSYLEGAPADDASAGGEEEVLSAPEFDLLLAEGLVAAERAEWVAAVENLTLAAESNPLRAGQAWRALSWVAEVTDQPEEALRYIELASTVDPTDVYTLLQRGRVLAARDDLDGASEAFTTALDQELRLPEALAGLGRIAFLEGRYADAEMYLERSVFVDSTQIVVHGLRGLNALMLGDVAAARDSFGRANSQGRRDSTARAGLAWCAYLDGEPVEAITLYRELDDSLRALPEEDPLRVYIGRQIARIDDHVEKVAWSDRFERQQLRNGWMIEEGAGPLVSIHDGAVWIDGNFTETGRSRLKREYPAGDFLSIEVTLEVDRDNRCRVGAFVSLEQARREDNEIKAEATISRNLDGTLQTRLQRRGGQDAEYMDVPVVEWPAGEPVVLRIDRSGESSDTEMRLSLNGVPVADRVPMSELGRTTSKLWVGVFAEGDTGRVAKVRIDRVEIIKRER